MSPVIQNAAFQAAGQDFVYVPLAVQPQSLPQAVAGLKAMGFAGVNVTVPHKVNIMPWLDVIDRSAELVGAVNTVVVANGVATGYNTDMGGFINSLTAEAVTVAGRRAVLLGAGGGARAIVVGLLENGAAAVAVGARDADKAVHFAASFATEQVTGCGWQQDSFAQLLAQCDILINCTPVGMYPHVEAEPPVDWPSLKPEAVVCDIIYNPGMTKFLSRAQMAGHKTVGGAGMLLEQGALAFKLWTGQEAPRQVMRQSLMTLLPAK
jgi:shikimate dehydrogenase